MVLSAMAWSSAVRILFLWTAGPIVAVGYLTDLGSPPSSPSSPRSRPVVAQPANAADATTEVATSPLQLVDVEPEIVEAASDDREAASFKTAPSSGNTSSVYEAPTAPSSGNTSEAPPAELFVPTPVRATARAAVAPPRTAVMESPLQVLARSLAEQTSPCNSGRGDHSRLRMIRGRWQPTSSEVDRAGSWKPSGGGSPPKNFADDPWPTELRVYYRPTAELLALRRALEHDRERLQEQELVQQEVFPKTNPAASSSRVESSRLPAGSTSNGTADPPSLQTFYIGGEDSEDDTTTQAKQLQLQTLERLLQRAANVEMESELVSTECAGALGPVAELLSGMERWAEAALAWRQILMIEDEIVQLDLGMYEELRKKEALVAEEGRVGPPPTTGGREEGAGPPLVDGVVPPLADGSERADGGGDDEDGSGESGIMGDTGGVERAERAGRSTDERATERSRPVLSQRAAGSSSWWGVAGDKRRSEANEDVDPFLLGEYGPAGPQDGKLTNTPGFLQAESTAAASRAASTEQPAPRLVAPEDHLPPWAVGSRQPRTLPPEESRAPVVAMCPWQALVDSINEDYTTRRTGAATATAEMLRWPSGPKSEREDELRDVMHERVREYLAKSKSLLFEAALAESAAVGESFGPGEGEENGTFREGGAWEGAWEAAWEAEDNISLVELGKDIGRDLKQAAGQVGSALRPHASRVVAAVAPRVGRVGAAVWGRLRRIGVPAQQGQVAVRESADDE